MDLLQNKKIFNPTGLDTVEEKSIIGGNTTNLIQLNNIKYKWTQKLYEEMMSDFWVPDKVDLSNESLSYSKLTDVEKECFKNTIGFLIFLDSIQVNNLPNIGRFITAPEIVLLLTKQAEQEILHSKSYQHILESIVSYQEREEIYERWRTNSKLFLRCERIANIYEDFNQNPTLDNFYKVLIGNYILEGIYFYTSFNFFYSLSSRSLLPGTADEIKYINIDELKHVVIFERIITELNFTQSFSSTIYELFNASVKEEIEWSIYAFSDILGFTAESLDQYVKYRANRLLKKIGLEPLYEGQIYQENPYKYFELMADSNKQGTTKANFFEATVTNYVQPTAIGGWDKI